VVLPPVVHPTVVVLPPVVHPPALSPVVHPAVVPPVTSPSLLAVAASPAKSANHHAVKEHVTVDAASAVQATSANATTDSTNTSVLARSGDVPAPKTAEQEVLPAVPNFLPAIPTANLDSRLVSFLAVLFLSLILGVVGMSIWKLRW
jgi:hypothetical protein